MSSPLDKKTFRFRIARESIFIFVAILGTYFLIGQLRAHIEQVNSAIVAENNLYGLRELHRDSYALLDARLTAIRNLEDQINHALPPTEDIRDFLALLETYANKHGVKFSSSVGSVSVSSIKEDTVALQTITIAIDLSGELGAVRGYIADLEHLPYFFTITSINEHQDSTNPSFKHTVISGTLWTKPQQTLTQMQQ